MRFHGKVGYGLAGEAQNGVWVDAITEREYYGDVEQNSRRLVVNGNDLNPDITVSNSISILADPYALDHFHAIKYVEWAGALYIVTDVTVKSPRLLLRLGGVYNGPSPAASPLGRDTGE